MPDTRRHVLAVLPGLFPSTIIGVAKPLLRLQAAGTIALDLTVQYLATKRAVARADVVVMCHTIDPQAAWILDAAQEWGRPIIYEIDDDLLDVPTTIPGLDYLRDPARRALLERCVRQAAVVRVYSTALQQKLSAYNDRVELVAGPLDWSLMPAEEPKRDPSQVRIVYATSRRADTVGQMLVQPLRQVLDRHPEVELTVWGPKHEGLSDHPQVRHRAVVADYDDFFAEFAAAGFDIGLAPLPDDAFHRGKSNNKFREYAACGIAGVYSNTPVYNGWVVDGDTGLLAENDEHAWVAAVSRLVTDGALRTAIGRRARDYARAHFNEAITDGTWMSQITSVEPLDRPVVVAPAAAGSSATAMLRHLGRLSGKALPVLRSHGVGTAIRRTWNHASNVAQVVQWRRQRRELERRVSAARRHAGDVR